MRFNMIAFLRKCKVAALRCLICPGLLQACPLYSFWLRGYFKPTSSQWARSNKVIWSLTGWQGPLIQRLIRRLTRLLARGLTPARQQRYMKTQKSKDSGHATPGLPSLAALKFPSKVFISAGMRAGPSFSKSVLGNLYFPPMEIWSTYTDRL